jgi:hypothetical protein
LDHRVSRVSVFHQYVLYFHDMPHVAKVAKIAPLLRERHGS